jgi:hypothetical protein
VKRLHLEERIALVRKALNERAYGLVKALPDDQQNPFRELLLDCIAALDGDPDALAPTPSTPRAALTVREACRRGMPLDGTDARHLEHALVITERERDEALEEVESLAMAAAFDCGRAEADHTDDVRKLWSIIQGAEARAADLETTLKATEEALQEDEERLVNVSTELREAEARVRELEAKIEEAQRLGSHTCTDDMRHPCYPCRILAALAPTPPTPDNFKVQFEDVPPPTIPPAVIEQVARHIEAGLDLATCIGGDMSAPKELRKALAALAPYRSRP